MVMRSESMIVTGVLTGKGEHSGVFLSFLLKKNSNLRNLLHKIEGKASLIADTFAPSSVAERSETT